MYVTLRRVCKSKGNIHSQYLAHPADKQEKFVGKRQNFVFTCNNDGVEEQNYTESC